ncbi:hypothetical protein [Pseudooceanicola sp. MF1-13]|uniref:hypothetical protein n=1 Tax=Pseudooceanicola sp. MF1-13 TaxID=3379095 RepID=UPI003891F055
MFCPPGYALLEQIYPKILDRSQTTIEFDEVDDDDVIGLYFRHSLNAMFALEMFLASCPSLSVCSPQGEVLRVSNRILTRLRSDSAPPDHRYFECIDETTWLVDVEPWGAPKPTTDVRERIVEALINNQRKRANMFSRFNGWSITIKQEDVPQDSGSFDLYLNFGDALADATTDEPPENGVSEQKDGRPPKILTALNAYCMRYPDGRKNTPVNIIQTSVIEQMGQDCSETTIRRVFRLRELLDKLLGSGDFEAGSELSEERVAAALDDPSELIGSMPAAKLATASLRAGYPFK